MATAPEPGTYDRKWEEGQPVAPPKVDPALLPDVFVVLDKQRWPFFVGEVTSAQARRVRATTGKSRGFWLADASETNGTEIDSWAVICWLARMQNGEPDLTLDEVEDGLTYGSDFRMLPGFPISDEVAEEEAERPEA